MQSQLPLYPEQASNFAPQVDGLMLFITLICLFFFGYFKSKMTGVHPIAGALRVMVIGALAAGCAFAVAKLVQGL